MAIALAPRVYGLDAICAAALRIGGGEEAAHFARRLFGRVADKDLAAAPADQRAAAATSLLAFARRRLPGVAKVRVFNPSIPDHGFESRHTIVQIVNDDMPFLVDSITNEFNRREIAVHLLAHPVMAARRDLDGDLLDIAAEAGERARPESMMHIEIDRQADPLLLDELAAALTRVLAEVRLAVEDWRAMRRACLDAIVDLAPSRSPGLAEYDDFLRWLEANHFTFLGHRRYRYVDDPAQPGGLRYEMIPGSALGILRRDEVRLFEAGLGGGEAMARFARGPHNILIVKTDRPSLVHRIGPMDCVIVKTYDADGRVTGERRLVGLFTSAAYHALVEDVPLLRGRVDGILRRSGLDAHSHDGKALLAILEAYPRDELFQIEEDTLYDHAMGILQLQERRRVALFARRDAVGRFATCLVFAPRERFDAALSDRFAAILEQAWHGKVTSVASSISSDSALAQSLYTLKLEANDTPTPDFAELEQALAEAATSWSDRFRTALQANLGEVEGRAAARDWRDWFPPVYRDSFDAAQAMADLDLVKAAPGRPAVRRASRARPRLASAPLHLAPVPSARTDRARRHPAAGGTSRPPGAERSAVPAAAARQRGDRPAGAERRDHGQVGGRSRRRGPALRRDDRQIVGGRARKRRAQPAGAGGRACLARSRDPARLRQVPAAGRHRLQPGLHGARAQRLSGDRPADGGPLHGALRSRPGRGLVGQAQGKDRRDRSPARCRARNRLDARRGPYPAALLECAAMHLAHQLLANRHSQKAGGGAPKDWISFKIDSRIIDELPAPRPLVEIFVYSPRTEGIHLRGGRVARGGIRWSDRREDFRTEILGLMKTQMVKNAVIVPVGSKGGFYVKQPPINAQGGGATREQVQAEGIACYQTLIRGLLDITDNYAENGIRPPADVVRHDGDDPYLVVAADKGTATFSDIANALAQEYGFWLDDAFASGGSAGYDHKKMGITARGAWESVKRHFRELGHDIQTTPFTVTGVGDMSGDVFGNGMLLSRHIKLVAAFDHRHIFIDPMPNPATSWAERQRLFDLPRSSWMDYDKSLLSAGGGIYDRAAKSIALSAEAQQVLGIEAPSMTPVDLMRAILTAPVDLLYFGGIGTYVKASSESQADAGDRASDAIRVDANQLRAQVVGEGANLGFTQRGRVEAALGGRKINTDALDNSAGVDTSDHEVNIKIATGEAITKRPAGPRRPRSAALLHDRRGRSPRAAPQLPAESGDQRRRRPGRRGARPAGALHARARAPGPARSRRRIPARARRRCARAP